MKSNINELSLTDLIKTLDENPHQVVELEHETVLSIPEKAKDLLYRKHRELVGWLNPVD